MLACAPRLKYRRGTDASRETPATAQPGPPDEQFTLTGILVPLDFSDESLQALEFAVPLAKRFGAFADSLPLIGINAESAVEVGIPAEVLAAETRTGDIDLVVTSTHGHTGLQHVLLGSTAEKLVRLAACPVLVVPSHSA